MKNITLGSTGITVPQNAFGALPIQRDDMATASDILKRAYEGGIKFFDTARAYTDSEKKLGNALSEVRDDIVIAQKIVEQSKANGWQGLFELKQAKQFYSPKSKIDKGEQAMNNIRSMFEEAMKEKW